MNEQTYFLFNVQWLIRMGLLSAAYVALRAVSWIHLTWEGSRYYVPRRFIRIVWNFTESSRVRRFKDAWEWNVNQLTGICDGRNNFELFDWLGLAKRNCHRNFSCCQNFQWHLIKFYYYFLLLFPNINSPWKERTKLLLVPDENKSILNNIDMNYVYEGAFLIYEAIEFFFLIHALVAVAVH